MKSSLKLVILFVLIPILISAQDTSSHFLDISIGGNYTNMKYLRVKQDQLSGNGVVGGSNDAITNEPGVTLGLGYSFRGGRTFPVQKRIVLQQCFRVWRKESHLPRPGRG